MLPLFLHQAELEIEAVRLREAEDKISDHKHENQVLASKISVRDTGFLLPILLTFLCADRLGIFTCSYLLHFSPFLSHTLQHTLFHTSLSHFSLLLKAKDDEVARLRIQVQTLRTALAQHEKIAAMIHDLSGARGLQHVPPAPSFTSADMGDKEWMGEM